MALKYVKPEHILLKQHPDFNEAWVSARIQEDTSILGLGELDVKDVERIQPKAGRLDLLLHDPETGKRYEVELMLGAVDESHIIRTIEYWDIERRRYPQYDHAAVIVAEDITTRFLNVISLFNSAVPIIAIQLSALKLGDQVMLHFTRVLDLVVPGGDDEDGGAATDRAYWEKGGSKKTLGIVDSCLEILRTLDPKLNVKYNKYYIGMTDETGVNNFVFFKPRRKYSMVGVYVSDKQPWLEKLEDAGLPIIPNKETNLLRFNLREEDLKASHALLNELFGTGYLESKK